MSRKSAIMLLLVVLVLTASSCGTKRKIEIWYGNSDRYAFMAAIDDGCDTLVVATIGLEIIEGYRRSLAEQGIQSDTLGAIQHLYGMEGTHFIAGGKDDWDRVARFLMQSEGLEWVGIRPSLEAMVHLATTHGEPLSKSETVGTLASTGTEQADIVDMLNCIDGNEPKVLIYDASRFLETGMSIDRLRTWMVSWTELILGNAFDE